MPYFVRTLSSMAMFLNTCAVLALISVIQFGPVLLFSTTSVKTSKEFVSSTNYNSETITQVYSSTQSTLLVSGPASNFTTKNEPGYSNQSEPDGKQSRPTLEDSEKSDNAENKTQTEPVNKEQTTKSVFLSYSKSGSRIRKRSAIPKNKAPIAASYTSYRGINNGTAASQGTSIAYTTDQSVTRHMTSMATTFSNQDTHTSSSKETTSNSNIFQTSAESSFNLTNKANIQIFSPSAPSPKSSLSSLYTTPPKVIKNPQPKSSTIIFTTTLRSKLSPNEKLSYTGILHTIFLGGVFCVGFLIILGTGIVVYLCLRRYRNRKNTSNEIRRQHREVEGQCGQTSNREILTEKYSREVKTLTCSTTSTHAKRNTRLRDIKCTQAIVPSDVSLNTTSEDFTQTSSKTYLRNEKPDKAKKTRSLYQRKAQKLTHKKDKSDISCKLSERESVFCISSSTNDTQQSRNNRQRIAQVTPPNENECDCKEITPVTPRQMEKFMIEEKFSPANSRASSFRSFLDVR